MKTLLKWLEVGEESSASKWLNQKLEEAIAKNQYDAAEKQCKWVILFKGVNEWEEFTGTEQEAHAHATCDDRHLNFSRTGYTLLPS